ncbi:MlaD family protein [Mycobacterium sp. 1274756.6]|uniref:MCE family protein n=1 Tax=Mycobacterium sp. 1274756.6 TaxID=1834076 RepID=UPI0007FCF8E6|nr:MlaD family protein [Mycobacterium sp. 1274756.6]OBJ70686.1 mammalian cell entry protein [Mycobacterium sp. 1274756.6]
MRGVLWRVVAFVAATGTGMFALLAVFGEFRFAATTTYTAEFADVTGLRTGDFVRIGGVEVGKVEGMRLHDDGIVRVTFSAEDSVVLTEGSRAIIRWNNVIGGRYLALEEGVGGAGQLQPGSTIPSDRTAPALDLDALIGGFRPLFRALDPEQANALAEQLITAFQGQRAAVGSLLTQMAALTHTLADRDALIGQVITNLHTVLGSVADHSDEFAQGVESLALLVEGLVERKEHLSNGLAYANAAAGSVADLLSQAREPWQTVVRETDRTAANVLADHDYFDDLLATLPEPIRVLNRQALNGDYFSFYLCDMLAKVNGKGGQPVYVKLAGQASGRCTPK